MRHLRQLDDGHVRGESSDLEIRAVHLEQQFTVRRQRPVVIVGMGSVGGADFDDAGSGARHDVGDPERPADLDQLAAGDDRLAVARQRAEREQHRAGGIIHDQRIGRTRQLDEQITTVRVTGSTRPAAEVVFERRITARHAGERRDRGARQRRATEIRVEHDARRVDHRR